MKKVWKSLAIALVSILTLGGCVGDPYPEMTDAQYNMVVRYAASLLTRYSKGTSDKLTYLDTDYTPEHLLAEAQPDAGQEQITAPVQENPQDTTAAPPVTEPAQQPDGDRKPDATEARGEEEKPDTEKPDTEKPDTEKPEVPEETAEDGPETEPEQTPGEEENDTPEQTPDTQEETEPATAPASYTGFEESGLQTLASNVRVEYTGYSVKNVYPDTQAQGAVAAAAGDKLLVVDFSIQNLTDTAVPFNTASRNPQFKLVINNDVQGFTMVTMIPNDLSGMDRELAPGERTDAVLLMEVPESLAKSVDTLDLIIKIRGEAEQTVKLE